MASQSTTSAPAAQGTSSVSLSPSASSTSVPPAQISSAASQASTRQSVSTSTSVPAPVSASASTSLSSSSQVTPTPISTSQSLPSTVSQPSSTPNPEADQSTSPMKVIIPVISAVAGVFILLLVYYFYRRYQRRRQLEEVPLPAKRTPAILERRQAQSMYRFETPNNNEYDSLMALPPDYLGPKSYLPFPSQSTNTFDGAYTHPSLTPSASHSLTPLASASASALSLVRQPSAVSLPTPPHEHAKDTSVSTLPSLTGEYSSPNRPHFLQQPFTPPHQRRDLRPAAEHSRAVSLVSVASRHSTYSLAATRSGQHPGSGGALRGAPHKNNMNIFLPQPLGPSSRPNSTYHMQHGESPPMHLQHMGAQGGVSPPVQGLWNDYGEIQRRSNMYRDNIYEEREASNLGNSQGASFSSVTMSPVTMPHSHAHTASAPFDSRHGSLPDRDVPPVPPLPPLFQVPRVDPSFSGTSNQTTSAFLTPATSLGQSQRPSPPRSPLSKQVSIDEVTPEPGNEVLPVAEPANLERISQLEGPMQQTRLLPDSVFTDPDGELENATIESNRSSVLFTPAHPPPTPPTEMMCEERTDTMDLVHHTVTPSAP